MSELTEKIAAVLEQHQMWSTACPCGEWMDSGPGPNRVRHNYAEHVAERIEAELGLTVEPGWVRESNGVLEHAVVGWVQPYTNRSV